MSNLPKQLKYTDTHEWINIKDKEITIGITEHAQGELGDLVFIELPEVGAEVEAGAEIGVLESVKAASDFYTPVTGVISAVNDDAAANPAVVNTDPYNDGWLVKVAITNPEELEKMLTFTQYEGLISKE